MVIPCDVCGKEFKDRWKVNRHMRVHTGDKPPKRETYDKGYLVPNHVKNIDRGQEKRYQEPAMATNCVEKTTGYEVFVQNCFAQHKRQNSDKIKDVEEFNKMCSVWWYNLPEADRQRFQATANNINQQQTVQGYQLNNGGVVQNASTSSGEIATFTYDYGLQGQIVNTVMDNTGQVLNYSTNTVQLVPQTSTDAPDIANKKSGYYIFAQEETQKIRIQNPNLTIAEVAKELGLRWNRLDSTERVIYEFRHQELRKQQGHVTSYKAPRQVSFKSNKKRRDPNAPKQPLTAFFIYSTEERQKVKEDNPTFSVVDVAKELGRRWSELEPETKQRFHARADELRQKFDLDMAAYKQTAYH